MTVLQVEGLAKAFGGLHVFSGVTFSVDPGEKLALIGPNGAGKTTLLNVIGGQLPASAGRVILDGKPITRLAPNRRLHRGLGRSFQMNNLFFELTVLENLLLAIYAAESSHVHMIARLDKRKSRLVEAERLLTIVGLWDRRLEPLHVQSYGDQRLVELVCAFAAHPTLVLLDEPSAGLPTAEAVAFADKIRELAQETTLLFCAHDMDLVFNLADNIMVLSGGSIIARGTPQEVSSDPKVRECYLGDEDSCYN
jgi:branched-chain amino acid transport system ATP-binding protein